MTYKAILPEIGAETTVHFYDVKSGNIGIF
jgi:hypothetical protein